MTKRVLSSRFSFLQISFAIKFICFCLVLTQVRCDGCKVWVHAECDRISSNLFKVSFPCWDTMGLKLTESRNCSNVSFVMMAGSWGHRLLLPWLQSEVQLWIVRFRKSAQSQVSLLICVFVWIFPTKLLVSLSLTLSLTKESDNRCSFLSTQVL